MRIVLASHSTLSRAMLDAAEMFLGTQENVGVIGLFPGDSPEDFEESFRETAACADPEEECLILCDILSGTPFNIASKISYRNEKIKVLYGMNLPIVVEVLNGRNERTLSELCKDILEMAAESYGVGKY